MSGMTVEQVRTMVERGMTDTEIGAHYGRERRTVQSFRRNHGIEAIRSVGQTRRGESSVTPAPFVAASTDTPPTKKPLSVAEFLLNKRKAVCPVCQLKEPIKAAVIDAKKKGERTMDILEYLQACHRITIQPRDYQAHFTSRHDQ
jgi:hypothetical protein